MDANVASYESRIPIQICILLNLNIGDHQMLVILPDRVLHRFTMLVLDWTEQGCDLTDILQLGESWLTQVHMISTRLLTILGSFDR